jgi:LytS/YehU family sensor histidine kinase
VLQAARLREDVAQANLQALRAQINPHFLFNALNSVVTLIGRDPTMAREMLVRLSELLRATLTAGDSQETTLAQELEITARYLEIEQVRFADRLTVEWSIDAGLSEWRVPAFALQPLVENALKYGLALRRDPGTVRISARADDTALELTVRDDGPDAPSVASSPASRNGAGIALRNLRSRLERLYGADASLELRSRESGGTDAVVRIPRRVA